MKRNIEITFLAAAVGAAVFGCGGSGGSGTDRAFALSIQRTKNLDLGLLMYSQDYDAVLPLGANWMDGITPYVSEPTSFRSPAVQSRGYGYALNQDIAGRLVNAFSAPDETLSIFDSTVLTRNAVASASTMPAPPRYGTHNTRAFLDGHVADDEPSNPSVEQLYSQSQSRLRTLGLGMQMYGTDYDEMLPLANRWMDELDPYVLSTKSFRSPMVERQNPNNYGYALNQEVAGASLTAMASPATTILLFDSTVLTRNATASVSTQPSPPRYGAKNTVIHADGSVAP